MATKTIAWNSGSGNITLTYGGQGDGTITIESSDNDLSVSRSQQITVQTTAGSPQQSVVVTITQAAKPNTPNFILSDGKYLLLSNGEYFNVQEN